VGARNHPFVGRNKRTAAVVSETFLMLAGYSLDAANADVIFAFLSGGRRVGGETWPGGSVTGSRSAENPRQPPGQLTRSSSKSFKENSYAHCP